MEPRVPKNASQINSLMELLVPIALLIASPVTISPRVLDAPHQCLCSTELVSRLALQIPSKNLSTM